MPQAEAKGSTWSKYVSFSWFPLEATLSKFNVSHFFLLKSNF